MKANDGITLEDMLGTINEIDAEKLLHYDVVGDASVTALRVACDGFFRHLDSGGREDAASAVSLKIAAKIIGMEDERAAYALSDLLKRDLMNTDAVCPGSDMLEGLDLHMQLMDSVSQAY